MNYETIFNDLKFILNDGKKKVSLVSIAKIAQAIIHRKRNFNKIGLSRSEFKKFGITEYYLRKIIQYFIDKKILIDKELKETNKVVTKKNNSCYKKKYNTFHISVDGLKIVMSLTRVKQYIENIYRETREKFNTCYDFVCKYFNVVKKYGENIFYGKDGIKYKVYRGYNDYIFNCSTQEKVQNYWTLI